MLNVISIEPNVIGIVSVCFNVQLNQEMRNYTESGRYYGRIPKQLG